MSQERVYVMYRLKAGVSMDDYVRWSQEVDQPTTPHLGSITNFGVRRVTQRIEGPQPAFDIIEEIDVTSVAEWQEGLESQHMERVQAEWPEYADVETATIVAAVPIPPATP